MIPFRVVVRIQVVKGRRSVWKSDDLTMVTVDGKQSPQRAVGAAVSVLSLIATIRNLPLNQWLSRATIDTRKKRPLKRKTK